MRVVPLLLLICACGGGTDPGGVYFEIGAPLDTGETFWDAPFPSDLRLRGDGTIDLAGFPNPRNAPILEALLVDARARHGFPEMPVGYFRFREPPPARDPDTLVGDDALLVDVSDGPEHGRTFPLVAQTFTPDKFAPSYLVGVAPRPGVVLAPKTTYAFVLKKSFAPGVTPPPAFEELAHGGGGETPANKLYAPLWLTLADLGVARDDVLVATVFTTGDEVELLHARTEAIRSAYDAVISDLHVDPTDGATHDGFCELVGTVTYPQFQTGTQPFDTGGVFVLGADGTPMKQGEMTVPLTITLPLRAQPATGFPLSQFFHGSGGLSSGVVDLGYSPTSADVPTVGEGPAWIVAKQGLAAASSALPLNPERLPGAADTAYLNINNLTAFPYTFQQGVIEQRLLTDALSSLSIPSTTPGLAACESRGLSGAPYHFDTAKLVAGGQSMGGMYTNMIGAVEPRFGALVPTGAGGFWSLMITKTSLVPGALQLLAAAFNTDESQVTFLYPGMHALSMGWEIAEPMVSMSRLAQRPLAGTQPRNVYEPVGYGDMYFPYQVYDAAALAYGNSEAGTPVWPSMQPALALEKLDGLLAYPVRGNRGATTNVVVQYMGDGIIDPHYLYRQIPAVKHQYACFLRTFLDTGTATVVAPGAIDDPCN
jgi:hypothetical protein